MRAPVTFVRAFIKILALRAEADGTSLQDSVISALSAKIDTTVKGKILTASSASGTSVTYSLPAVEGMTDTAIQEAILLLSDRIDAFLAQTPGMSNDALVSALLGPVDASPEPFATIKAARPDFTGLVRY